MGSFHVVDRDGEDGRERVVRRPRPRSCPPACWLGTRDTRRRTRDSPLSRDAMQTKVQRCIHMPARCPVPCTLVVRSVCQRVVSSPVRGQVRIFYGEGDRFGCWLDVAADAIAWHALGSPDAGSALLSRAPRGAALANRTRAPAGAAAGALAAAAGTPRAVQRLSRTLRLLPR